MESLHTNEVWDLVELPSGRKAIGCKRVFKRKHDVDGSMERHKARLVAQGFNQKYEVDYDETFCPVRFESVRTIISLAAKYDLKLHQADITIASLNGELKEDIYLKQPIVARFCSQPTKEHWIAVKHILRYLKSTRNYGLW